MIFVDTNVLIDAGNGPSASADWSRTALASARVADALVTNHVVFAELAPRFAASETVRSYLETFGIAVVPISDAAAPPGGRAHAADRRAGGAREAIRADFLIGGHAAALGAALLTRDRQRFASYFPELDLITPEDDNG